MPQYKRKLSKGLRWYYKFTYKGKTYHSQAKYLTRLEAKKAESIRFNQLEQEIKQTQKRTTLLTLVNIRLDYLYTTKSSKYYKESKKYLRQLYEHIGNIDVRIIEKQDINELLLKFANDKKESKQDNYAVNALLRTIKALFNHGIKYCNLEIVNPCQGIEFFPINKKLKYIPTDQEINDVLEICNPEQRRLVEFVRDTGCRISEALNLRHRDILDDYVVFYTRKSKASNLVPRKVKYDTSRIIAGLENDKVFKNWADTPKFLYKHVKLLDQNLWGWHNLRHRYASLLSKSNTPLFEIMSLLGHSNLETTQKYLQLLP